MGDGVSVFAGRRVEPMRIVLYAKLLLKILFLYVTNHRG
jgi:hypothetical protein